MAEYIEREALFGKLKERSLCLCVTEWDIRDAPAADVAPIRHGFWVSNLGGTHFCSECGRDALYYQFDEFCFREELTDFCPRCGALLDLEEPR